MRCEHEINKVNDQDFLQVFQGSGMGKIEDNLTSADPLSYTTTIMIPGRPGKLKGQISRGNFQIVSQKFLPLKVPENF